ncbi:hypothetical protein [Legionella waltersii]|uniref:Uncharacterized protein n=1 Tax=Legionella waltersii TaxID=66969 RepID=A0A0W1A5E3_9GAMM|nr:hypothetical protein [Legionella waltersii]KTD76554.1 hypothetical protein Lwal_2276 [Legionella waltersii]SNU94090.1 Uncharacterised protein [Legionella waltersii]
MSIIRGILLFLGMSIAQTAVSEIPVEVIGSCKNAKAVNPSVTVSELISPAGLGDDETGCLNHFESTKGTFNFGSIICNDENYLILQSSRINLNTAQNHSVNPSYTPGADIAPTSDWLKIIFNNLEYLCISVPLSSSGDGASVSQYYIVENAFNSSKPILHYYFFNREIMPMTSTN